MLRVLILFLNYALDFLHACCDHVLVNQIEWKMSKLHAAVSIFTYIIPYRVIGSFLEKLPALPAKF